MFVLNEGGLPIKVWSVPDDYPDGDTMQQARNLANHPLARKWVCLMPDYHVGYGMPIGGVLATQGGVVPNAVGVDIGCGMIAVRTSISADDLSRDDLAALRGAIHGRVPVGMKHHDKPRPLPYGLTGVDAKLVIVAAERDRAAYQIGTLGGGNHFIELQRDTEDGALWIMLHSGSRNVGKRVCDYYDKIAKRYMKAFSSNVPDLDLAFLPDSLPEYGQYMAEMQWCMAFAEANREEMLDSIYDAFDAVLGVRPTTDIKVDTHHNFAAMENHYGQNVLVHRKGAVKATGLVTIPGSMGTASYICEGLTPAESFNTCSHGAGRVMGRAAANRFWAGQHEQAAATMAHVVYGVREGDYDELPSCYKDIDAVIEAQADLVRPVHKLLPLAVVKG